MGLVVLSGCRIEKPATVVPLPPSIDAFTASAPRVAPGGVVTLSWKTSEAKAIELREASTGALNVAADAFEGSLDVTVSANSLFVLTARGPGGTDARAVSVTLQDTGVGEVTFQALPPGIVGGESTTLVWTAPGATAVSLSDGTGTVDVRGQRSSGAVTVTPLFDTTYTLTAGTVTRTAAVVVDPAVLSLEAAPQAVAPGETVTLRWTAAGAERLLITSPGRGPLAEITDPARIASGSYADVAPALPSGGVIAYVVSAVKGTATRARQAEVFVGTDLAIVRFDAPPVASPGASYSVRWQTLAADRVELKLDGTVIHQTATAAAAASGIFVVTAPTSDFAVELVATNTRGGRVSQVLQVDVVGVPTTATLTASPATVTASQPVTLTFACPEARRVRIVDATGETVFSVTGQVAEGGTALAYPNADTTYTLFADNLLGNPAVSATAAVTVTGTPITVTQFPPTAISGQNVQLTASQSGALYYGFPHPLVQRSNQADFIDIRATGIRVLESGSNVATVDLPFTTWLWGTRQTGPLTISRAGWMAWGAPLVVNSSETTLPSTSTTAAPGLIAPFWDNLSLTGTDSAVFAQLVGNAPEQSLVVQWDHLEVASSATTEVTFQARVHQNGMVSFHYQTMTLSSSTYSSFTAGVQDNSQKLALTVSGTPVGNSAVYFFSPVTSVSTRVVKGSRWGGFVQVGNARMRVSQPALALDVPADLGVSELMFRPAATLPNGQYLELFNRTAGPLDLTGWELRSSSSAAPFSVANGFSLQPGLTLLGASTDPLENDDAGVSVSWGAFSLSPDAGTLTFTNPDAGLSLPYAGPADAGTGTSLEIDFNTYLARSGAPALICPATRTFGSQTPLQHGSPGTLGNCFGYSAPQSIPSRYVDISATGARLVNSATAVDGRTVPITLAATGSDPAPLAFGVRQPVVSMSIDGWMSWGSTTSTNYSNKSVPSSTTPLGLMAPFWDDLQTIDASPTDLYWKRFAANEDPVTTAAHWVFSWHHLRHFNTSPADDLNFEVKLFEDGTIEYHYGTMTSGTSSNYADGNSATVWLEEPTGFYALPLSVNDPLVAPNTAYRFVPQ